MGSDADESCDRASRVPRVRRLHRYLAGALLLAAAVAMPPSTRTEAFTPTRFVSGWIPYWVSDWQQGFDQASGVLADVSPMAFQMNEVPGSADPLAVFIEQTESAGDLAAIISRAREAGALVVPAIFDQTNNNVMAQIIADPARRGTVVQAIAALVNDRGFDGIDLDWEKFAFGDSPESKALVWQHWPVFLAELDAAMPGKVLSVTVPPIWTKNSPGDNAAGAGTCDIGYPGTAPTCRGYRQFNWAATIGAGIVDRFRIMVYDWSTGQAGPIAPVWWYRDVVAVVKAEIPSQFWDRVQLGVPSYGRNWAKVVSGTCPTGTSLATQSLQLEHVAALADSKGATIVQDAASNELTFSYDTIFSGPLASPPPFTPPPSSLSTVTPADEDLQTAVRLLHTTCVVRRTVWFPNEWTIAERAVIADQEGLGGIVMWAFGYENAATWALLSGV
jgi:spore germination protein YaaH